MFDEEMRFFGRGARMAVPFFVSIVGLSALLFADSAMASGTGETAALPWEDGDGALSIITNAFRGPIAYAISLVAVISAGIALAFGGQFSDLAQRLLYVAIVIGVIVSAGNFLADVFSVGALV